uniref:AIG1-type G domain-containing protein n=1 Tax=Cyprinus carpio TaxID=7962 RepID=A0A8C1XXQ6_CYPCA
MFPPGGMTCPTQSENIVLIGNTGNGKSSVGNMILRKTVFITKASANSVTTQCQRNENMVSKKQITVIDTPDFFDIEDGKEEEMKSEILKALIECAEGIHTFIIVLKVGRFTKNEKRLLNTLTEDALKHTLILFTFGEQLEGQTIEEFLKTNSQLKELADKCGGRCHVIDKYWNRKKKEKPLIKWWKNTTDYVMKKQSTHTFYRAFLRRAARITTLVLVDAFLGAQSIAKTALGPDPVHCVGRVTGGSFKGAVSGVVSGWNAKDADSEPDTTSKAATTSFEKAITLMNDAQTKLESAQNMLEAATNMLKKK